MKNFFTVILSLLFMGLSSSLAAGTEANTSIINQASATYIDSLDAPQFTTSNSVTTIVQQVYGLTITPNGADEANPGQTQTALPGAPVYFNYRVTNTGNGDDTITLSSVQDAADAFNLTNVRIYLDTGCDGSIAGDSVVSSVALGADDSACIIVSGTIPSGTANGAQANYNLSGSSANAATPADADNWARAVANTGANLSARKTASPSGAVAPGSTITYTISGSNNGGSAAYGVDVSAYTGVAGSEGIVITDTLDSNLSYAGNLTGTAGAGTVSFAYRTIGNTSWTPGTPATGVTGVTDVAMIISAPAANVTNNTPFFPQSTNYSMSFSTTVAAATAGTPITNRAVISYSVNDDAATSNTTTSAPTNNTVAANNDVAVGPAGLAAANPVSGTASYTDSNGNTWNVNLSGGYVNNDNGAANNGDDTQTLTSPVSTGDRVAFRMSVANTGNVNDTFTISAASAAGYGVQVFNANGTTPLNGALSVPAGATQDIVVKITIPANATAGDTISVVATSASNAAQNDVSFAVIPAPAAGYSVDIAQQGESNDANEGDDTLGDVSANPGDTISFPIEVSNTGTQTDSFTLSAALPTGWNVSFVVDANCDGVADGATVSVTRSLAAGATACYVARVSVPVSAAPSLDNPVSFTATSNANPAVSNTVSGTADVATTAALSFINNQSATTAPNSVVTYTHTLINDANAIATVSIAAQTGTAFTYQYALDSDGDGDASDETFTASLAGITVPAKGTRTVFVQVIVPGDANEGDRETATITATATYTGGSSATASVQDTTEVLERELELVKSARTCTALNAAGTACDAATVTSTNGGSAEPGDYIEYTIIAENLGSADISNVKVIDPLPASTNHVSASATTSLTGAVLFSDDGADWTLDPTVAGALSTGQSIYVGVSTDGNTTITDTDIMTPGAELVLTFLVQVQ